MNEKYEKMINELYRAGISCIINCDFECYGDLKGDFVDKKYTLEGMSKVILRNPIHNDVRDCNIIHITKKENKMKIKIFEFYANDDKEKEIQDFLDQYNNIEIKHIMQSQLQDQKYDNIITTITIFYEENNNK